MWAASWAPVRRRGGFSVSVVVTGVVAGVITGVVGAVVVVFVVVVVVVAVATKFVSNYFTFLFDCSGKKHARSLLSSGKLALTDKTLKYLSLLFFFFFFYFFSNVSKLAFLLLL